MLWTSDEDKSLGIVEMRHRESNWEGQLTAGVFASILEKLSALHEKGLVHGDIRLVNLLSTGYIVDFDFVGLDTYPEGLNQLDKDGKRHPDVATAISEGRVHMLKPQKEHDCFSMAVVLELFISETEWWQRVTKNVKNGHLSQAIMLLEEHKREPIFLRCLRRSVKKRKRRKRRRRDPDTVAT
jgi:serine/threonine protein kinase